MRKNVIPYLKSKTQGDAKTLRTQCMYWKEKQITMTDVIKAGEVGIGLEVGQVVLAATYDYKEKKSSDPVSREIKRHLLSKFFGDIDISICKTDILDKSILEKHRKGEDLPDTLVDCRYYIDKLNERMKTQNERSSISGDNLVFGKELLRKKEDSPLYFLASSSQKTDIYKALKNGGFDGLGDELIGGSDKIDFFRLLAKKTTEKKPHSPDPQISASPVTQNDTDFITKIQKDEKYQVTRLPWNGPYYTAMWIVMEKPK